MSNLSNETKTKIIAETKTFLTVFVVTVAAFLIQVDTVSWSVAFWSAAAAAGLRAAITVIIAPYLPIKLGGKKE